MELDKSFIGKRINNIKKTYLDDSQNYKILQQTREKLGLSGTYITNPDVESSFGTPPTITGIINSLNNETSSGFVFEAYDSPSWNVLVWSIFTGRSITGTINMVLNGDFFFGVTNSTNLQNGVSIIDDTSFSSMVNSGQTLNKLVKNNVLNLNNNENAFGSLFMRLTEKGSNYILSVGKSDKYHYNLLLDTLPTKFIIASKRRMTFTKTEHIMTHISDVNSNEYLLDGREVVNVIHSLLNFDAYTSKFSKFISFSLGNSEDLVVGLSNSTPELNWNRSFTSPGTICSYNGSSIFSGGFSRTETALSETSIFVRAQSIYGTDGGTVNLQLGKNTGEYKNCIGKDNINSGQRVVLYTFGIVKFSLVNYSLPYFSDLSDTTTQLQQIMTTNKYNYTVNPQNSKYYTFINVIPGSLNYQPGTFFIEYEHDGVFEVGVCADQGNNTFSIYNSLTTVLATVNGSTITYPSSTATITQNNANGDSALFGNVKQLLIQVRNNSGTKTLRIGRIYDSIISSPVTYTSNVSFFVRPSGGCTYFRIKRIESETGISSYYTN